MKDILPASPRILSSGWGKIEVEKLGRGKDFKLWPGGGRPWDWSEFGTGHGNGIQQGELAELISRGCRVVVLTKGRFNRLKIPDETVKTLEEKNIEVIVADTKKGIDIYNSHVDRGTAVGGLFHSTC
jgi:hypothetical protein